MAAGDSYSPNDRSVPALRASDAERERTADVLRDAAGEGRLTVDELDERLTAAYAAVTRSELEHLVTDVLVPADRREYLQPPSAGPDRRDLGRVPVRVGDDGDHWLVAVMGGLTRKGHWRLARRCTAVNVMGGSDLDLCDVELAGEDVELTVVSLMGGSEVRIPDHMNVRISDFAIMGGNEAAIGDPTPDPGGPVVHLRLISIMGGSDVKRGRKIDRKEQRRLERQQRKQERRERRLDR